MSLLEVLLIAVGAWIILLVVTHAVKGPRRWIEYRRIGFTRWDGA